MSATYYPAVGQPSLTATALRAAAELVHTAAATGVSVTCNNAAISIQITDHAATITHRAATLARLAARLGSHPRQENSPTAPHAWLCTHGQLHGIPVSIYTPLRVSTDGELPFVVTAEGDIRIWSREPLPAGTRWHTELDTDQPF